MPNLIWDTGRIADQIESQGGYALHNMSIHINEKTLSEHETIHVLMELNRRARDREDDHSAAYRQGYEAALREVISRVKDIDKEAP